MVTVIGLVVAGEKPTVTPAGAPLEASVTGELNPPRRVSERLVVVDFPCASVTPEGLAASEKLTEAESFQ